MTEMAQPSTQGEFDLNIIIKKLKLVQEILRLNTIVLLRFSRTKLGH